MEHYVSSAITIRDFANITKVSSVPELKKILEDRYRNKSISLVHHKRSTGMKCVNFVSIDGEGNARQTYKPQTLLDFDQIEEELRE